MAVVAIFMHLEGAGQLFIYKNTRQMLLQLKKVPSVAFCCMGVEGAITGRALMEH